MFLNKYIGEGTIPSFIMVILGLNFLFLFDFYVFSGKVYIGHDSFVNIL